MADMVAVREFAVVAGLAISLSLGAIVAGIAFQRGVLLMFVLVGLACVIYVGTLPVSIFE